MPLVECKLGYAETQVSGNVYTFDRDQHGRFVALVENPGHMHCLLSVSHYQVVEDELPEQPVPAPTGKSAIAAEKPKRGRKAKAVDAPPAAIADAADADADADATEGDTDDEQPVPAPTGE